MARQLRVEREGGWYHVGSRGIEKRDIFRDDRDRMHWLGLLEEAQGMFGLRLHSYVMMSNHFHLEVETPEGNLSRAMHWLNTSYTVWFNKRHRRVGPLFQGRYKAVVVDPEDWGLELSRYIHLNPVRIGKFGLTKSARQSDRLGLRGKPSAELVSERIKYLRNYRWSSYRAYIGLEKTPNWLECRTVLEMGGGRSLKERRQLYRKDVESAMREGLQASPWEHVMSGLVLGGKEFLEQLRGEIKIGIREVPQVRGLVSRPGFGEVIEVVEKLKGEAWDDFRDRHGDWGRDLALYLGRKACGMRLNDLGVAVGGVDYAAVSAAVKRFERRIGIEKKLARLVRQGKQLLKIET